MKADFRRAHADMARRTKAERQGFVKTLGDEVASLMAGFHRAHKAMARQTKAERRAAVNHLKKTVGGMRREFALDLAGAHRVWCGPTPAERRAKARPSAGPRPRRRQRAKEAAERERMAALAMAKEESQSGIMAAPRRPKKRLSGITPHPRPSGCRAPAKRRGEILKLLVSIPMTQLQPEARENGASGPL